MPCTLPIELWAGESTRKRFTVRDEETDDPVDLTGATIEFEIKAKAGDDDPALVHKEIGDGIELLTQSGDTLGQGDFVIDPEDTAALDGMYMYDLVVVSGGERRYVIKPSECYIHPVVNGAIDAP